MNNKHMKAIFFTLCFVVIAALANTAAGQGLSGTLVAGDTGSAVPRATVVAVQKMALPSRRPVIFTAVTGPSGEYTISAPAGIYQICVHGAAPYLDPCQWGAPVIRSAAATVSAPVPTTLQRGANFIFRIHDSQRALPRAEAVAGASVRVDVSGGSAGRAPLPVVFDDGRIRDYGALVPLSVGLTAVASSSNVALSDTTGAALGAQGIGFQIVPADVNGANPLGGHLAWMFPRPVAKIIHVFAAPRN